MSLHKKFTLSSVLFVAIAVAFLSWQAFETVKDQVRAIREKEVTLLSEVIVNGLGTTMVHDRGREFPKFLDAMVAGDIAAVRIYTDHGVILNSSPTGEADRPGSNGDAAPVDTNEAFLSGGRGREILPMLL